jgi:hypothetical protein
VHHAFCTVTRDVVDIVAIGLHVALVVAEHFLGYFMRRGWGRSDTPAPI